MKKLLLVVAVLMMMFTVTACGSAEETGSGVMIDTVIEIDYPDGCGIEDVEATVSVEEGTSAMDMLYQYADENGIEVGLDESSPTIYVISINGVEQTGDAGWVYEIDDEMTMDAADDCILTEGMEITWEYMSWGEF
jgi:hypothetical protein